MARLVALFKILIVSGFLLSQGAFAAICEGNFDSRIAGYEAYLEVNEFLHGRVLEGIRYAKHQTLDGAISNPGLMPMTPRNEVEEQFEGAGRVLSFRSGFRISGQLHKVVLDVKEREGGFDITPYLFHFVGTTYVENKVPGTGFTNALRWEMSKGFAADGFQNYLNPVGPIRGFTMAPHKMTQEELAGKGISEGQSIELVYESGIIVRGQVKALESLRANSQGVDLIRFVPGSLSITLGETDFINQYGIDQDSLLIAADVITHAEDFQRGPWVPFVPDGVEVFDEGEDETLDTPEN